MAASSLGKQHSSSASNLELNMAALLECEQLAPLLPLYQHKRKLGHRSGHYLSRIKGRGMVFSEVRAYQAGDDVRAIDWRVTARTGKAHTKLYQEERERPVFILLDLSPSMRFGSQHLLKSTQASYLAATVCWSGIKAQDRVGLIVSGLPNIIENKPVARKRGLLTSLQNIHAGYQLHLQQATQNKAESIGMAESLTRLRYHAHTGSLVIVISDFYNMDAEVQSQLQQLGKHNQVVLYPISDPLESDIPAKLIGALNVSDGSQVQVLNIGNKTQQNRLKQGLQNYQQNLQQTLLDLHYPSFAISAALPLEKQLGGLR